LAAPINRKTMSTPTKIPGYFFTRFPTFVQKPRFGRGVVSTFGINGQNALRPIKAKTLGIKVNPAIKITTIAKEKTRSEERRVGKECRDRRAKSHGKN